MAVTRRVHHIWLPHSPFTPYNGSPELFELELNKILNGSERIVFMGTENNTQNKWLIITEELVMGPTP